MDLIHLLKARAGGINSPRFPASPRRSYAPFGCVTVRASSFEGHFGGRGVTSLVTQIRGSWRRFLKRLAFISSDPTFHGVGTRQLPVFVEECDHGGQFDSSDRWSVEVAWSGAEGRLLGEPLTGPLLLTSRCLYRASGQAVLSPVSPARRHGHTLANLSRR